MVLPLITGLLGLSLGSASAALPVYFEAERLGFHAPPPQNIAARLQLSDARLPESDHEDLLTALAIPEDLVARVTEVTCHLSRSRGAKFTPTSRAPYAPVLFVAVTLGPCPN